MSAMLRRLADPQEAAKALVDAARNRGGNDNITVVVVDVVDVDDDTGPPEATIALPVPGPDGTGEAGTDEPEAKEPGSKETGSKETGSKEQDREPGSKENGAGREATSKAARRLRRLPVVRNRPDARPKERFITVRVVVFAIAVLLVLAAGIGAIVWYAGVGLVREAPGSEPGDLPGPPRRGPLDPADSGRDLAVQRVRRVAGPPPGPPGGSAGVQPGGCQAVHTAPRPREGRGERDRSHHDAHHRHPDDSHPDDDQPDHRDTHHGQAHHSHAHDCRPLRDRDGDGRGSPMSSPTHRAPARRRTELGLILLVVALTGGLYALAGLGKAGNLPANMGPFLATIFGLLLIAHLAMRRLAPLADPILLPCAGLLNGIGYVFIARLSTHEARLQAVWTALGVAAFIATLFFVRRARDLERYRYTFAFFGIGLLLLPLLPGIGEDVNGARLWIHVGAINFQPGEISKLALAIFFASVLVERGDLLSRGTRRVGRFLVLDPRYLAPIMFAWGLSLVIFLAENDIGSSFLFFALFIGMLWVATGRAYYLGLGAVLFGAGSFVSLKVIGHAQSRVQSWLDPWAHSQSSGFQVIQGWFAIAAGGLFGEGPGQSSASSIPEASTDLIFAVIADELGLFGAAALLITYLVMVGSGLRIAVRCDRQFDKLLATGLSLILGIQSFVIIAGVTRLIPLTGITLPFVSYGGSSLVANYILLALLLRISHDSQVIEPRVGLQAVAA